MIKGRKQQEEKWEKNKRKKNGEKMKGRKLGENEWMKNERKKTTKLP